jgi:hypothetical protein
MGRRVLSTAVVVWLVCGCWGRSGARADYLSVVLADGPLAYWRLGEASGPVAYDASGNAMHGTYIGGVTLAQAGALEGDADTAVCLDGVSGCMNMGWHPELSYLSNDFTIEAWYKGEGSGWIVSTRDSCG